MLVSPRDIQVYPHSSKRPHHSSAVENCKPWMGCCNKISVNHTKDLLLSITGVNKAIAVCWEGLMRNKEFYTGRTNSIYLIRYWLVILLAGILGVYSIPAAVTASFQG